MSFIVFSGLFVLFLNLGSRQGLHVAFGYYVSNFFLVSHDILPLKKAQASCPVKCPCKILDLFECFLMIKFWLNIFVLMLVVCITSGLSQC